MQDIVILVGTMTGTAELVAQEVDAAIREAGHPSRIMMMDAAAPGDLERGIFLVCTSTYGNGDVPDNAQAFYQELGRVRPDLSGALYSVIALGDMTYRATFCQGGLQFDAMLESLGATRISPPLMHDASGGTLPEDVAAAWARAWVRQDLAPLLQVA
jgi:MioC protein